MSLQGRRGTLDAETLCEAYAVVALDGVGGDSEWWLYSAQRIGHLRAPVTKEENPMIPEGLTVADAGDSGPLRPRTAVGWLDPSVIR